MDELALHCPLVSIHNYGGIVDGPIYGTLDGYDYATGYYEVTSEDEGVFLCRRDELKAETPCAGMLLDSLPEGMMPAASTRLCHNILLLLGKDVPYAVIASWPAEALANVQAWANAMVASVTDKNVTVPEMPAEVEGY